MAFYTTYTTVVPFNTSNIITKAATSNVIADMFVAYGGCTLVGHATEGVASSTTNYAEITYGGMFVRFFDTSTSNLSGMTWVIAATSGGTQITSSSMSFSFSAGISTTVSIMFYNTISGFMAKVAGASNFTLCGLSLEKLSDGTAAYAICPAQPFANQTAFCNDGLMPNRQYWCISTTAIGPYHADSTVQILNNTFLVTASNGQAARYRIKNVYACAVYNETNIVEIDGRYFYIGVGASAYATELNP